jgi:DNA-directed RNA polymerase subunit RPC12/RpoP
MKANTRRQGRVPKTRDKEDFMDDLTSLVCPYCRSTSFVIKYEASHIYSYVVDSDAPGRKNSEEFLSFLFDKREQTKSDQYAECQSCGSKYPCSFNVWNGSSLKELQEAINNYNK